MRLVLYWLKNTKIKEKRKIFLNENELLTQLPAFIVAITILNPWCAAESVLNFLAVNVNAIRETIRVVLIRLVSIIINHTSGYVSILGIWSQKTVTLNLTSRWRAGCRCSGCGGCSRRWLGGGCWCNIRESCSLSLKPDKQSLKDWKKLKTINLNTSRARAKAAQSIGGGGE